VAQVAQRLYMSTAISIHVYRTVVTITWQLLYGLGLSNYVPAVYDNYDNYVPAVYEDYDNYVPAVYEDYDNYVPAVYDNYDNYVPAVYEDYDNYEDCSLTQNLL
jgi:hypothetical protein